jgi:2-dehydro-3-deoxyphosphogluconate aldolase/(4S)-4-hydroxy-2-oxoglutarate aldolase
MPHVPIMPTGGINVENAAEWVANGAVCLGLGSSLMDKKMIVEKDFEGITAIARSITKTIKN